MVETVAPDGKRAKEARPPITHVRLAGLLPQHQILVLNRSMRTVSLLAEGPTQLLEQRLSADELRLLLPILEAFPQYCPYEVLLSSLFTEMLTPASIHQSRRYLQEALARGTRQQELRPVRRALTSLRSKLRPFELEISTLRQLGCCITSATGGPGRLPSL